MPRSELKFRSCTHAHDIRRHSACSCRWGGSLHADDQGTWVAAWCKCWRAAATHQRDEDLADAEDQDPEADAEGRARVV